MAKSPSPIRDFISEWTINILILLFGTTTLVQAFIVPTPSMDKTVMVGDHLLVDKLSYSPAGPISQYLLPYTEPKRGDIIVFRYPVDISENYVKRVMGVPGDRIHLENKMVVSEREETGGAVHTARAPLLGSVCGQLSVHLAQRGYAAA